MPPSFHSVACGRHEDREPTVAETLEENVVRREVRTLGLPRQSALARLRMAMQLCGVVEKEVESLEIRVPRRFWAQDPSLLGCCVSD